MGVRKESYPFPSADYFYLLIDIFVASVSAFNSFLCKNDRRDAYLCAHERNTAHLVLKL